jgi:peptidoglycan/LPS O-acetylase OafA/YrhL
MWRVVLEPLAFFLAPFALYALMLVARQRYPFVRDHWPRHHVSALAVVGMAAAAASIFIFGGLAERHHGAYVPAHMENGKLVPGRLE